MNIYSLEKALYKLKLENSSAENIGNRIMISNMLAVVDQIQGLVNIAESDHVLDEYKQILLTEVNSFGTNYINIAVMRLKKLGINIESLFSAPISALGEQFAPRMKNSHKPSSSNNFMSEANGANPNFNFNNTSNMPSQQYQQNISQGQYTNYYENNNLVNNQPQKNQATEMQTPVAPALAAKDFNNLSTDSNTEVNPNTNQSSNNNGSVDFDFSGGFALPGIGKGPSGSSKGKDYLLSILNAKNKNNS